MHYLFKLEQAFDQFSNALGKLSAILLIALLLNVVYDVIMRYVFNDVSIGMQELEWHLYASVFLLGMSYTLKEDAHVRVDILYENASLKTQAIIDIVGTLLFLIPFCVLVISYSFEFAYEAYDIGEQSADPGGLPSRWIIKSMIPISFICLIISAMGFMLRAFNRANGIIK